MSDQELVSLLSQGDQPAFAVLFRRYWDKVFQLACLMLKSEHLAEEAVQEVFLRIWKVRAALTDVRSFDSYLFISARNHILNTLRRDGLRAAVRASIEDDTHDDGSRLEHDLQQKDLLSLLDKAVNTLPQQQRVAFRLAHQSGLGISDIGTVMGISRNTVRNHLARALQTLRSQLRGLQEG